MDVLNEYLVWQRVRLARHPKRPTSLRIIRELFPDFLELHGDRQFGDDFSLIAGLATFHGIPVTIIAQEKGTNTEEKIKRNFGMPHPEGYRKALRFMKQAEKFGRPILCFIDTPGAYPGIGAEERGQAQAIAYNLYEMIDLQTPVIAVVLSEGGSGGALAIGVSDALFMLDNDIYSIISPEGFASILFKDSTQAKKAASLMKLTAPDLLGFKIIDGIIPEVETGFQDDIPFTIKAMDKVLLKTLQHLRKKSLKTLLEERHTRFRNFGTFAE
jgi:acetyl-CoA carboxylase carboxyl transferase subunit alpha